MTVHPRGLPVLDLTFSGTVSGDVALGTGAELGPELAPLGFVGVVLGGFRFPAAAGANRGRSGERGEELRQVFGLRRLRLGLPATCRVGAPSVRLDGEGINLLGRHRGLASSFFEKKNEQISSELLCVEHSQKCIRLSVSFRVIRSFFYRRHAAAHFFIGTNLEPALDEPT